jgi:MbtH protein
MSEQLNPVPGQSLVLKSDEAFYSLWPAGRAVPAGWNEVGITGTREECLAWIEAHWTDMRPRALQVKASAGTSRS